MFMASSRAPSTVPLPFLERRHPLRAALFRWRLLRRWLLPAIPATLPGPRTRVLGRRKHSWPLGQHS